MQRRLAFLLAKATKRERARERKRVSERLAGPCPPASLCIILESDARQLERERESFNELVNTQMRTLLIYL